MTFMPAVQAGVNFVLHTAGWLEGGLAMGYEKFILDCDQADMMSRLMSGVDLSENGQALESLLETGPGKHYLGTEHTMKNFETAFWASTQADVNSFEQWEIEGKKDSAVRAHETWKQMLRDYEAPPLDEAVDEQITEWIAARKASFPDASY